MPDNDIRIHEVTFCGRVSKWADTLFASDASLPFERTEIEQSKGIKKKRSDLRVYDKAGKLVLAGEVKLPGTVEGINPHNATLVEDAYLKASNAGAKFFFTWNVNRLVLFDSTKWEVPLFERRVKEYDLHLNLDRREDVDRPEVETAIKAFLAEFFGDLKAIADGTKPDWGMAPDEYFIRAFESHISWPVKLAEEALWEKSAHDKTFDAHLQEWMAKDQGWLFTRNDPKVWREMTARAARTLCYVFSNRLLFYESVRAKFDELKKITVPKQPDKPLEVYTHFQKCFQKAVEATGDYETLFYPFEHDWAGPLIFLHKDSPDAWRSVLHNLEPFNFKLIPTDILGGIFKRLIDPDERHKFGQHYTNEDLVDVVNAFCIRKADDTVLDPACGSGSFIVRAYHRKAWLDSDKRFTHPALSHQDRLAQIYGADIALFAAHLSTLNLAARDVNEEENYPRIARRNFFEVRKDKPFCQLPRGLRGERQLGPVELPELNAVVGNPPYVRQEHIPKRSQKRLKPMQAKEDLHDLCASLWNGLNLSGRSDLHCYFWPAATHFLTKNGWFGFLVSSSWLDVEYGFALQEWVLTNFKIHAILESNAEPWFEDARVKTCAVILQRCDDPTERDENLVKFVRLEVKLKEILGDRTDETARQKAAETFRDLIARCKTAKSKDGYRIIVKQQKALWEDGLKVGRLFDLQKQRDAAAGVKREQAAVEDDGSDAEDEGETAQETELPAMSATGYGGGKWGKYLRAPNLYFRIMEKYGNRFVPLGEISNIRRGITSGCDAFFMPRDVTQQFLADYPALEWNDAPLYTACKRPEVASGTVKLILAGDKTVHPVEAQYLAPEVHSLMKVNRAAITAKELDRVILYVSAPMDDLKGTYVHKYLRYGERTAFASKKSKAVPVPQRTSCASRDPWYDLTFTKPGRFFWPMAQQYRHVIPANPENLICNHNLFDVHPHGLDPEAVAVLTAVVNSTLVANFKTFYGRYAGTEGNLKTEVVDVNLLEVPDPRLASKTVATKLKAALQSLCQRDTQPLLEQELIDCRSSERAQKLKGTPITLPAELQMQDRRTLDLAVFELLGVLDPSEQEKLCHELYYETANHFRQIRIVEIQKQEQRAGGGPRGFRTDELAADLWDALADEDKLPLHAWLQTAVTDGQPVTIPEGRPNLPDATDMLDASSVFFTQPGGAKGSAKRLSMPSRTHAEIVYAMATYGLSGSFRLPKQEKAAQALQTEMAQRLSALSAKAMHLAHSRTTDEKKAADIANLLTHWLTHGKPGVKNGN
jgi:methylase of polypeptide subunit release factors